MVALTVNDRPIWSCLVASLPPKSHECSLDLGMHRNVTASYLAFGGPVFQCDYVTDLALGIGDHGPSDRGDLHRPHPALDRQKEHHAVAEGITPGVKFGQDRSNLFVADDLCLLAKGH